MFAGEWLESRRFSSKLTTFMKLQQRQARAYLLSQTVGISLPNLATGLVLCYGGKLAMEGKIQSGMLLSFVFYLQKLNDTFGTLGDFYTNMVQALGAATRVFELKGREAKLPLNPLPEIEVSDMNGNGELRLVDIHFSYPARPDVKVLSGLNLTVPAGQTVALVGPSGNGKSTVIGLLKRLYKAEEGQVLLDGVDIWNFKHAYIHRSISIVGQEPVLYARTIRENILFGLQNPPESEDAMLARQTSCSDLAMVVSDAEIEEAAQTANAHSFISNMPEGYGTEVGERGVQLSGGQKQRIAIARALVRQPKVLLLDEATSALDAESERQVQQAIDGMMDQGRMTVVIIAHRLSTVRRSHKICVVQGGKVVEEGPHDELVKLKGAYFNLVESQLSGLTSNVGHAAAVDGLPPTRSD
jgi:ATP-binding cassette subfamily B (MDR/TAP) protein 9